MSHNVEHFGFLLLDLFPLDVFVKHLGEVFVELSPPVVDHKGLGTFSLLERVDLRVPLQSERLFNRVVKLI